MENAISTVSMAESLEWATIDLAADFGPCCLALCSTEEIAEKLCGFEERAIREEVEQDCALHHIEFREEEIDVIVSHASKVGEYGVSIDCWTFDYGVMDSRDELVVASIYEEDSDFIAGDRDDYESVWFDDDGQPERRREGESETSPEDRLNPKQSLWSVVLNNPRHYLYRLYVANHSQTQDDIFHMSQADLALNVARSLCPENMGSEIGVAVSVEEGSKYGAEHCHIAYYSPDGARFRDVQNLFFQMAHIEPRQKTLEEVEDYLNKRGEWGNNPEGHTLKVPPVHLGLPF